MPIEFISQEMMDLSSVKQEPVKAGYRSLAELFADPKGDEDQKHWLAWQVAHFVTLNGITKVDLQAMLRFIMEEFFHEVKKPALLVIKGREDKP